MHATQVLHAGLKRTAPVLLGVLFVCAAAAQEDRFSIRNAFVEPAEPILVQASAVVDDPETRERELRSLEEAMQETGSESATIVTLETEERVERETGVIEIVPAWKWLLR